MGQYSLHAGAASFDAFLSYSKTRKTNIFFLLHISRVGLEKAGCASDEGEFIKVAVVVWPIVSSPDPTSHEEKVNLG